jgi:NAD(P)-dependent dehydrogenase (short-subunit alcohol dehydrogenase family)
MTRFTGKVALVTGGTSGIGFATARLLAREGAAVVICGRSAERLASALGELAGAGCPATGVRCDVSDEGDVERLFAEIEDRFAGLDVCVCNAGIETDEDYSILDLPAEVFDENMAVNVRGVFLTARGAARLMRPRGAGAIVAIGSSSGIVVDLKDPSPTYNATKAAVHMFARSLAVELAPFGIRVNAVAPGWVETGMTATDDEETVSVALGKIPLGRYGTADEIAEAIAFAASDAASFMTGAVLVVDGGETLS